MVAGSALRGLGLNRTESISHQETVASDHGLLVVNKPWLVSTEGVTLQHASFQQAVVMC